MPRKRPPPPPRGPQLEIAKELCIAFINTAGAQPDNRQLGVSNYTELITWCQAVEILTAHDAERLRQQATEHPAEAQAAFNRISTLRDGLTRSFLATQRQKPATETDLADFNRALAESSLAPRLITTDTGANWAWTGKPDALDSLLSPILSSAFEVMLNAAGRPHVRQCAAKGCRLFFIDPSPTGHRKWCEAKCGHRIANLRYYRHTGKKVRV